MPRSRHVESHRSARAGWLRAAVLGANDGIVSIAGLLVGVAAGGGTPGAILSAGIAGTVAGAMSMAAGEYVSVRSQADIEEADLETERRELRELPDAELAELAGLFEKRGLSPDLARQVAVQLTAHDALAAHAREELGINEVVRARPLQAAMASAAAFCAGAALPIVVTLLAPPQGVTWTVTITTVVGLFGSGALAAWAGGANPWRGALRVGGWGAAAMAAAHLIGGLFNVAV
ncbi:protein of unknown function DUF125 transmembrane [Pseudoxanthomonas suwonensis 11-1]|uniref:Nodulin 21 n=1 Tax=Pseudoxanthomonas suwonensis (strain 11-1) TaxID=743721 RepID=E6WWN0_PSEUU|nr:VIT family protein [Pseudoxanthomonas suwonensis]ADV28579.1 protein of unknown function DUF125 transmembrane [Pseudoxanthomonas suwonensis 11-1]